MKLFPLALLLVALPVAAADPDPLLEPYAPFKLIAVMPDTAQVLLWDENAAEYRLAKAGDDLDGWKVSGLDTRDARGPRVALQKEDLIDELELVRLPRPGAVITFKETHAPADRAPVSSGTTVITTTPAPGSPPAPAAAPIEPTVISAAPPAEAPPSGSAVAPPPVAAPPAAVAPPAPAILEETRSVRRADFDREINDFDKLMGTVAVAPADGPGFKIVRLEPGSWVASLGFRAGDVVRSVAGEPVSTVEDAARVYSRLRGLSTVVAEIERGSTRVNLRLEVKEGK